ncbi:PASTA domain-containing penicillin-binding protein [Paenibacillus alkalitolerans]|uniref:PASTA domain-containing penicillin-binding protein n=1 Tax=Paenibacillus alkalitolerans TaxID=2799335 RepID=UPI0018F6CA85|nr:PASTA domain-containing penicillin-binding protein [Paenibacillus alkalitolerans]
MKQKIRVRSLMLGVAFTLFFIGLVARLYWLQVVEASWLVAQAERMWATGEKLEADRGTIYDRKMQVLAADADGFTVVVNPQLINQLGLEREVASGLSGVLGMPENKVYEQVTAKNSDGKLLRNREIRIQGWKIPKEVADRVREWEKQFMEEHDILGDDWVGVGLRPEKMRYYPKNSLASHMLGYIDKDGRPWAGLESALDEQLRGTDGSISYQKDERGNKLPGDKPNLVEPVDGKNVVLTIDQTIQHYTEQAMKKVYDEYEPKRMTAIAVDPKTMEVLALANYPNFDPNKYWEYKDFRNMAIASRYEPGSTFKIVTLTGAVDQGLFDPNATFDSGSIKVPGRTIRDHRRGGWGTITYLEGLLRSSNVAFVKLGYEMLKEEKFMEYIERFGFTRKTGIDLPGEVSGAVNFQYPADVAAGTYGQGRVQVTPMHQISAYAAIANGGKLMEPYVVKKVLDPETNEVISEHKPKVVGQVVSEQTANQVKQYLEQVVADQERGTGRRAYIEEYRVAGKTGTANVVVDGGYATCEWVVSFIGFAPVDDPRIAVAVIADSPNLGCDSNRAGEVTAPVFKEIVSQSLRYMGVPTERKPDEKNQAAAAAGKGIALATVPDLHEMETAAAVEELKARGFSADVIGDGNRVLGQYPPPGEQLPDSPKVYLLTVPKEEADVPDLTGESLRDAVQLCALLGLRCQAEGEGYVVAQEVVTERGETVLKVTLKPLHEAPDVSGAEQEDAGEETDAAPSGETDVNPDGGAPPASSG